MNNNIILKLSQLRGILGELIGLETGGDKKNETIKMEKLIDAENIVEDITREYLGVSVIHEKKYAQSVECEWNINSADTVDEGLVGGLERIFEDIESEEN